MSAQPSEKVAVVGAIDPDAAATGEFASDWVYMRDYQQVMAIIQTGILVTTTTVDAKMQEAKTSTGGSVADISGKAITQLDTDANDSQAIINVEAEDLSDQFDYVRLLMTLTLDAGDTAALVLGLLPRQAPANDNDLASVVEII